MVMVEQGLCVSILSELMLQLGGFWTFSGSASKR